MVKVIHGGPAPGPDIITARDFLPPAPGVAVVPVHGAPPSALAGAQNAVNEIDKWINIADKGITMLGRLDSILGRVQGIQANRSGQPAPQQHQVQSAIIMPEMGRVNADPPQQLASEEKRPREVMDDVMDVHDLQKTIPPGIQIPQLLQVMDMIDKLQPGITVRDLHDSIARNPDQVSRLLAAYMGVKK